MNKIFSKNSLRPTKQAISRNSFSKHKAIILICLMLLSSVPQETFAAKVIGDPNLKAQGFISKIYDDYYSISRDNTIDFIYNYSDGSQKTFTGIPVFPNGNLVLPNIGEEHVYGLTIKELQELILEKTDNVTDVEIFIKRIPNNFSVLGEVNNPGSFKLEDIRTIYDGIAKAKGFTDVARKSKVTLIRQREDGSRYSYIINFPKEVFEAYDADSGIGRDAYLLKEGDLIYVYASTPKKVWKIFKQALSAATLGVFAGLVGGALD